MPSPIWRRHWNVSAGVGAGEEEDVLGDMPPTMQTLLYLRCLRQRAAGCGGKGYPEKVIQLPRNKVAETLLLDVRIRQDYDRHHFDAGHTLVHPGVQGVGAQDKRPALTVGRRFRDQPF